MKYIITGTVAFLIGLLITYAAFSFVLLETNPLKWSEESRVVFILFGWAPPALMILAACSVLGFIEIQKDID